MRNKKQNYVISKHEQKILKLVKIAGQIVLKEDVKLFKELAKH
jgi:hypothetical protein